MRHFALQIGGVGAQGLQHSLLVTPKQRLHEDGCVAQVGGHAHFGDADHVFGQRFVMHVAALEDFRQHVAHLFADAQRANRFFLGVFVHHASNPSPAGRGRGPPPSGGGRVRVGVTDGALTLTPPLPAAAPSLSQRGEGRQD
ncbi:hypothetical protein WR25_10455 [Diploscapter pachys]|uniref:Uncharacterized protein n=1 Tax=Diploscapter pachys TaxID=2018661 RepID=A0A2A2K8U2_9BILA|nr:hypothetical protein WR25_10455 [Diploscapter pachys]